MASAVSAGGRGQRIARDSSSFPFSPLPPLTPVSLDFPMFIVDRVSLFEPDRDYISGVNGSDRKGYGFVEIFRVMSMMAVSSFNLPGLPFALT